MNENKVVMSFANIVFNVVAIVVFVLFVFVIIAISQRDTIKQEAISLGYAEHNAKSGQWQWITNTLNNNKTN